MILRYGHKTYLVNVVETKSLVLQVLQVVKNGKRYDFVAMETDQLPGNSATRVKRGSNNVT